MTMDDKDENMIPENEAEAAAEEVIGDGGGGGEVEAVVEEKEDVAKSEDEENEGDSEEKTEEEEHDKEEIKSPTSTSNDRPTRERKTVERYSVALMDWKSPPTKSVEIVKGSGTQLKDIPNVAYKLSKRKPDDNLQLLHTILFGKKAKVHILKRDIGLFSGFVWIENEEKQRSRIKEKLDKCVKEKLLDFCDLLNIPVVKAASKKEDVSAKLLEFLQSPHATTDILLAEKDQKTKKRKSKGTPKSSSSKEQSAGKSSKKAKVDEKQKMFKADEDSEDEAKDELTNAKDESVEEEDDEKASKEDNNEEDIISEEGDASKEHIASPKFNEGLGAKSRKSHASADKNSRDEPPKSKEKSKKLTTCATKKVVVATNDSTSGSKAKRSRSKKQKFENDIDAATEDSPLGSERKASKSKKQKVEKETPKAKYVTKGGKRNISEKENKEPNREELHAVVATILKEVDFNTTTLSDILRRLGTHFALDLVHRKVEVKEIITEVINSMTDDEDDDEEEAEDEDENNAEGDADDA